MLHIFNKVLTLTVANAIAKKTNVFSITIPFAVTHNCINRPASSLKYSLFDFRASSDLFFSFSKRRVKRVPTYIWVTIRNGRGDSYYNQMGRGKECRRKLLELLCPKEKNTARMWTLKLEMIRWFTLNWPWISY